MRRRLRALFQAVIALAVIGLLVWAFLPGPIDVDAAPATRGPLYGAVEHEGKTRVRERYTVSSPLLGRLLRIGLKAGDRVTAGETLLAAIEPADPSLLDSRTRAQAEARLDAAIASGKQADSALERGKAILARARRDLERARNLRSQGTGYISGDAFDEVLYREQAAAAEVSAAEFARKVAEFEREQARAALAFARPPSPGEPAEAAARFEIAAPVSGVVLRVFEESMKVVSPGERLIEVGDPTDLECVVDVLSSDAVKVRPGQRALLDFWGGPHPLEARVRVREPSAFTKVSALGVEEQRVNIILDVVDPPGRRPTLGDGYRVEARIVVWEARDAIRLPAGALFSEGEEKAVYRVAEGRAVLQPVTVGRSNGLEVEVLGGLAEGDLVVLHPSDRVRDGVAIRAREVPRSIADLPDPPGEVGPQAEGEGAR